MFDHVGVTEHGAALGAERLRQRHGQHHVGLPGQTSRVRAAPALSADDAERVGLVDEQQGAVAAGDRVQLGQRRGLTVDREHRVGDDEGAVRRTT